ncbi:MAG: class I SAM-dependent methyltransferase [Candidatus Hodarchaeales archaeon]|jgi:ubiquinone/menaquinone biosynthesis C-methylase UbiE
MNSKTGYDAIGLEYQKAYSDNPEQKKAVKWVIEHLKPNDRVLDIGSGTGIVAKQLSEAELIVLGIDNSNEMNRIARMQAPKAKFIEMNFKKLKLQEDNFDAIVAFFSLLHVQKGIFKRTLQNILNHLRSDGYFVISMVEGNIEGEEYYMNQKMYFSSFPREELTKILQSTGLIIKNFVEYKFTAKKEGAEEETQLFYFTQKK